MSIKECMFTHNLFFRLYKSFHKPTYILGLFVVERIDHVYGRDHSIFCLQLRFQISFQFIEQLKYNFHLFFQRISYFSLGPRDVVSEKITGEVDTQNDRGEVEFTHFGLSTRGMFIRKSEIENDIFVCDMTNFI